MRGFTLVAAVLSPATRRPGFPAGRLVVRRHIDLLRVDSALCPRV
ncbi:hypothetical protein ACIQU5_07915 [Streptomyces sp. NPDC090306]